MSIGFKMLPHPLLKYRLGHFGNHCSDRFGHCCDKRLRIAAIDRLRFCLLFRKIKHLCIGKHLRSGLLAWSLHWMSFIDAMNWALVWSWGRGRVYNTRDLFETNSLGSSTGYLSTTRNMNLIGVSHARKFTALDYFLRNRIFDCAGERRVG